MSEGWKSTHKFSKVNALRKMKGGISLFSTGRTKTLIFNLYLLLQKPQAFSAEKLHLREQMEGISTPYSQRWLLGGRKSGWQLFPSWLALEPERSPEFLPFMHQVLSLSLILQPPSNQKGDVNSHLSVTFPLFSWVFLLWMLLSTLSGPSSVCMNCPPADHPWTSDPSAAHRCSCCSSPDQGLGPCTTAGCLLWFCAHHVPVPLELSTM